MKDSDEPQDDLFTDCREGNHKECLYQWPDPTDGLVTCNCSCHTTPNLEPAGESLSSPDWIRTCVEGWYGSEIDRRSLAAHIAKHAEVAGVSTPATNEAAQRAAWKILDALGYPYNREDRPEVADWHQRDIAESLTAIITAELGAQPSEPSVEDAPSEAERQCGAIVMALLQKDFDAARELALTIKVQFDTEGPFIRQAVREYAKEK